MKVFFPDSRDSVDPSFNFQSELHPEGRIPQRDDCYIFEVLGDKVIDGLLIAKSSVVGTPTKSGKYTLSQQYRLLRNGAREYFRLTGDKSQISIMGDCGAFAYAQESTPPYSCQEVLDFYSILGVDYGIAPDAINRFAFKFSSI